MKRDIILASAWTFLSVSALGSVILAAINHVWPITWIQILVTLGTSAMAAARWSLIYEEKRK